MSHTPGPWTVGKHEQLIGANGKHIVVYNSGLAWAGSHFPEAEANACLIAAAPELLGALKAIIQAEVEETKGAKLWLIWKQAREAIDKAEGK